MSCRAGNPFGSKSQHEAEERRETEPECAEGDADDPAHIGGIKARGGIYPVTDRPSHEHVEAERV